KNGKLISNKKKEIDEKINFYYLEEKNGNNNFAILELENEINQTKKTKIIIGKIKDLTLNKSQLQSKIMELNIKLEGNEKNMSKKKEKIKKIEDLEIYHQLKKEIAKIENDKKVYEKKLKNGVITRRDLEGEIKIIETKKETLDNLKSDINNFYFSFQIS